VLAAYVVAFAVARGSQRRPLARAALATVLLELPWPLSTQLHGLRPADYSLSNLFDPAYLDDHRGRVGPSASELLTQMMHVESWSYVLALVVVGFGGALVLRRWRAALFGAGWAVLSFGGLLAIYWI